MPVPEVYPLDLHEELLGTNPPLLVDVREQDELDISRLAYLHHIPVREFEGRFKELNPEDDLVIYCRTGVRSRAVTKFLLAQGYSQVRNLATGINGWAREVDPGMPIY